MRVGIDYGLEHVDLEVDESRLIGLERPPTAPPLPDPVEAVRVALEAPFHWPSLRRALTPDDHVAIVLDEQIPGLTQLLPALFDHLLAAHIALSAVTVVCPPGARQGWIQDLPDEFADVHVEEHDPTERKRLAYLATTRHGRRVYLNRTVVDADQIVVFTRRTYDPVTGYGGAEAALYPALSDEATRNELYSRPSLEAPGAVPWPAQQEAQEVAWLLGAPFLLQVIEGRGGGISHVLGGSLDSSAEGQRLLDATWRLHVDRPADVVIVGLSGAPAQQTLTTVARALGTAARVVQPGGKIVLLTEATPDHNPIGELLRRAESPREVLAHLQRAKTPDLAAALPWASAAQHAHIYLLSRLDDDTAEEMFVTPLQHARQVQKLLTDGSCLLLPDADKALATVK